MFEAAELGHRVDAEEYERQVIPLRQGLLAAQYELLAKQRFACVVIVSGVDGAGKGETVNLLNEWMDPRHIATHAITVATDEERARPPVSSSLLLRRKAASSPRSRAIWVRNPPLDSTARRRLSTPSRSVVNSRKRASVRMNWITVSPRNSRRWLCGPDCG